MKLLVGIDVSSEKLDTCFLDSEDQILLEECIENSIAGASKIKSYILKFHKHTHYERIIVAMESTSVYSFHPASFLAQDQDLKALGIEVSVINPKIISPFKGMFDEDKTDSIDAYRIADFLRFDRFNLSIHKVEQYLALQGMTRSRYQLISQLTEMKQHFLENLYYKCNTLTKEIDTSVFGATMMELLTDSLSLDEIANMPLEDLAFLLQEKGRGRFSNPTKLAKSLSKAIRDSYRLGKVMQDSVDIVLASYANMIQATKKQINRFKDEAKIAKYAGLYWKRKQSSNYESQRTSMTKTGNRYLRYYLVEAATSVMRNEPVYRQYYLKIYNEVPKNQHKSALVLTARKLVRLVDVLLRNHQLYAPERSA